MSDDDLNRLAERAKEEIVAVVRELRERITALEVERNAATEALEAIAERGCGLPGHAVAVGCGANEVAASALLTLGRPLPERWHGHEQALSSLSQESK